jgi:hypothetical protein
MSGSYTLPLDIQLSGTYQFSRGIQNGGAGPSLTASWAVPSATAATIGARAWTGVASRTINLIEEGSNYGKYNLNQLDVKFAKRFTIDKVRLRADLDVYNLFNSSWPYTVTTAYSTAPTGTWQRPTNVLQNRFFKLGGTITF